MREPYSELAELGSATVYEAAGRSGYLEADLVQIVPGSRAAGPARTVSCGQDDNLMVHAVMAEVEPGDVLVLTMPEPRPIALVGELLATQAKAAGAAAILVDAAVRDVEELAELGLPIWARWVRVRGAVKDVAGTIGEPVVVGGRRSARATRSCSTPTAARWWLSSTSARRWPPRASALERERVKRAKLERGELSLDLDGLRERLKRR